MITPEPSTPAPRGSTDAARCSLPTTHSPSATAHCPLPTAHSPSETAHCPLPTAHFHLPLLLNAFALVLVAVWFRGRSLENIPGINGDEAWYGVQAWWMLHGAADGGWHTPTGNPINPLFVGPLALLHIWFLPSIGLLRSVALASGLAALAVNWLCCRWVFDRRTALISTVALAVLPINIAYSRFAWDASQSLAATLPVAYLALAAVQFPGRFGRCITASSLALAIAIWVHPTNLFAVAALAAACTAWILTKAIAMGSGRGTVAPPNDRATAAPTVPCKTPSLVGRVASLVMLLTAVLLLVAWIWAAGLARGSLSGRIAQRVAQMRELLQPRDLPPVPVLFSRLFTGGTIYRYIPGARSWFEWPLSAKLDGWGLDVGVFWAGVCVSAWMLWRSYQRGREHRSRFRTAADGVLLAAWVLEVAAFLVVAGPRAMAPGQERFAICLIGPTVLLGARGASLAWEAASLRGRVLLAAATLAGWAVLADFHAHYFCFIERTGGQAHLTFRTGAVEPKQAALQYIVENAGGTGGVVEQTKGEGGEGKGELWIVCSEWWNLWPIRYLAAPQRGIYVVEPREAGSSDEYRRALAEGGVWFVEFCGTDAERQVELQLAGRKLIRRQFYDYGGRPVVCVLHPLGE